MVLLTAYKCEPRWSCRVTKQGFDSGSQDLPDSPGSSRQHWQHFYAVIALPGAAIRQEQKPTLLTPPMETKTTPHHAITRGRIELYSSSISVTCEASGDSIELSLPYGTFRDALKDYVVHRLSRATQEELISLMTEELRKRDAKEEA